MSEYKSFISALKQRNTRAMKNPTHQTHNIKEKEQNSLQAQKDQVAKLKFLRSKKARKGLPSKIRSKMFKDIEKSVKQSK